MSIMKRLMTQQIIAELGTMTDLSLAQKYSLKEQTIRKWRNRLEIPTFRTKFLAPRETKCANCQIKVMRRHKAFKRSKNLFCGKECANQFQKTRDSEALRYGTGWK